MADIDAIDGGARIQLSTEETHLLRQLTREVRSMLTDADSMEDPVVKRLLPATYEDEGEELKFRDVIGDGLAHEKAEALDKVESALGSRKTNASITGDDVDAWLATLTDIRLALGIRLDVDEERMSQDVSPRDPDAQALTILHWLGWLQERLIATVDLS